jgi:hypothetical protein
MDSAQNFVNDDSGDFKLSEIEIRALKSPTPRHIEELVPRIPEYELLDNYYEKYWDLYLQNE